MPRLTAVAVAAGTRPPPVRVTRSLFGTLPDGRRVDAALLRNATGVELRVIAYGGIVQSLRTPDRGGRLEDVVLGHDTLAAYLPNNLYFGCLVGRHANRIANGRFVLDGKAYALARNDGGNHLHGGTRGWDQALWEIEGFEGEDRAGVRLRHTSPDGDEGYPGTVTALVTYTLSDSNELLVEYEATTDAPTIVNLTQHSYFNLAGPQAPDILDHELTIAADRYTPVDASAIPTGPPAPVDGTPFDFRKPVRIGARIESPHEQLRFCQGYDHNWVLNRAGEGLSLAARLVDPASGRTLEVRTSEPGLHFYSGNFLDGTLRGPGGRVYGRRAGLCLETQHFPDSPNRPEFPSTVLRPGDRYRSLSVFAFGVAR